MKKITVGVADDHPIVLLGVSHVLAAQPDMSIEFQCDNIADLMANLQRCPVDVLLCDFEFAGDPQPDGLELLRRIKRHAPDTRILLLSSHSSASIVSASLAAGALGFIGKGRDDFAGLAAAIKQVDGGGTYLHASIASDVLSKLFRGTGKATGIAALSEREVAVARMTGDGLSISEIAQRLKRSPKTVSNQKVAAMKKLGAKNDVELARIMRDSN